MISVLDSLCLRFKNFALGLETLTWGDIPALDAISINISNENKLILPRIKSETRGCVTPKISAASA